MVINDAHRFIFVHVPKAAGTSIARVLCQLDGNNPDVVSPVTRHETLGQLLGRWRGTFGESQDGEHRSAYFVFGFVRNPWERVASLYRYLVERRPRQEIATVSSFRDFIEQAGTGVPWIRGLHSMRTQVDFFRTEPGSHLRADFVGHFESLREDLSSAMTKLRIAGFEVPHENRTSNADRDYRPEFSDRTADIVASLFREDIETFGYDFDRRAPKRRWPSSRPFPIQ
jgi:hypothetical protein